MSMQVVLHLGGEDAILADMDKLPGPTDQFLTVTNPRKRDGKPLTYITDGATSFLFPMTRITFIEIMGGEEEAGASRVVAFFREDTLPKRR